ncbi:hypothetical protein DS885_03950 [Psychromonas sp. B3M02]|uniref:helix-turn-helix domain-containing protein n=1 Tax=Psychromonas sp. B3M02 TaxID=2267226 RepID=UPI000DEBED7B|nr:helix-turn-helix transcriptional regulator [Psychromonas sp. B3M02]RBW47310.1 hypothetical protein DS885_03950 [Psychromonas sp. B3M02]
MSESKPMYNGQSTPNTLEAFKNRNCGLGIQSENYVHPTTDEVRALRKLIGFSQNELALFTGVGFDPKKGSSTIRKWEEKKGGLSCITKSSWQLMLIKSGLINIDCI